MRAIILAALVAAGIGLVGTSGVSAAPANGVVIGQTADENSGVVNVRHWRHESRRHWRRDWNRCHWRHRSGWYRC
jgi:hypothetical protein